MGPSSIGAKIPASAGSFLTWKAFLMFSSGSKYVLNTYYSLYLERVDMILYDINGVYVDFKK